jgi:quinol monooxygenase YgiN
MGELMVVWEGRVPPDRQAELLAAYHDGASDTPPEMTRHLIARDIDDPQVIRLVSFWRSPAALQEYRRRVETPAALLMFRSVGVEPTRAISEALEPAPDRVEREGDSASADR